jgi:transcriptional regulator with XRE-family HTH domain
MPRRSRIVDKHVSTRLRIARVESGKSQTAIAEPLGITFQQIQKYENGTNRISSGTLYELSLLLDKPLHFFFDGLPKRPR